MPADKQSALAALDVWFSDAVKGVATEALNLIAGKDASIPVERSRVAKSLDNAVLAYEWTKTAINDKFK